jgi:hypothetical protein
VNTRSTYVKPEGVTIMGAILLAVAFALPIWGAVAITVWLVTR